MSRLVKAKRKQTVERLVVGVMLWLVPIGSCCFHEQGTLPSLFSSGWLQDTIRA